MHLCLAFSQCNRIMNVHRLAPFIALLEDFLPLQSAMIVVIHIQVSAKRLMRHPGKVVAVPSKNGSRQLSTTSTGVPVHVVAMETWWWLHGVVFWTTQSTSTKVTMTFSPGASTDLLVVSHGWVQVSKSKWQMANSFLHVMLIYTFYSKQSVHHTPGDATGTLALNAFWIWNKLASTTSHCSNITLRDWGSISTIYLNMKKRRRMMYSVMNYNNCVRNLKLCDETVCELYPSQLHRVPIVMTAHDANLST